MKISNRIIAKFLMLCGIALTCTACYAAPRADYGSQYVDSSENEVAGAGETTSENTFDTEFEKINETPDEE